MLRAIAGVLLAVMGALILPAQCPPPSAAASPLPDAAPVPDLWGRTLPSWIPAASISVTGGNESNIYGVSDNLAGHPDIANIASWFTTLDASLTFDLLAGSGPQIDRVLKTLTLGYSAEYSQYAAAEREDNLRNTFTLDAAGGDGPWSFSIDNPLLYVDGSKEDEFFNFYNNLGYGAVRERRSQIQERNTSFVRYDSRDWFVRAADSAIDYNMLVDQHNPVGAYKGYANWVDRDDMNAGVDLGFKVTPDLSFVAGWRIGQQTQAQLPFDPVASDSTYNRTLLGLEGKPLKWLRAQLVAGPDFRRYSDAAHLGLNGDRHTWLYFQGQLTASFTPRDAVTASEKVWHFVSSAGVYSIQETTESVTYKHLFSKQVSTSVGVRALGHRYDAPTVRDDWATVIPANVTYASARNFSVSADYSATSGRSHLPTAVTPGQSFEDNLVSLSLKTSF